MRAKGASSSMTVRSVPVRVRRRLASRWSGGPDVHATACHAPFASMFLDQQGGVRACCQNASYSLGRVTEKPLSEIWRGGRVRQLRRALERGDYSLGCEFCEWQVADGHPEQAYAREYDAVPVNVPDPEWPTRLELSLSNTCNLQCVMCNGDWSSAIRSRREHRPPLPVVYDDAFFEDLRAFVPHLKEVKLLGGEPFLATESLRLIELLVEAGSSARCHVTTNGTQWTPRVERVLDRLQVDIAVSVDGATRATYEAIRQGASWDDLQRNLDRFQEAAEARGTHVGLAFCLMVQNWHEFAELCRLADRRDLPVCVNTVTHPTDMSLFRLSLSELDHVVKGLEADEASNPGGLRRNAGVYAAELNRLRRHRDALRAECPVGMLQARDLDSGDRDNWAAIDSERVGQRVREILETELAGEVSWLDLDHEHRVVSVGGASMPGRVVAGDLVGHTVAELHHLLGRELGEVEVLEEGDSETVRFERSGREIVRLEWNLQRFRAVMTDGAVVMTLICPRFDGATSVLGTRLYIAYGSEAENRG